MRVSELINRPFPNILSELSYNRLLVFFAYVAARNPRTQFIIYSRSVFQRHGGEQQWVAIQEARLPVLRNRLHAFIVPGGQDASFRQPETAQLLRARVTQVLGVKGTYGRRLSAATIPSLGTDSAPRR